MDQIAVELPPKKIEQIDGQAPNDKLADNNNAENINNIDLPVQIPLTQSVEAGLLPPTRECAKRLKREWMDIVKSPPDYILACPHPDNILEWHYVILGPDDSPYEGGVYHGSLKFKHDYPLSPPSIYMHTPSGRFKPDTKLCLSISDFHPETWSPTWSVSSIMIGLLSFMLDNDITYGSISTSYDEKRKLSRESLEFNKTNTTFREMFPFLVE